MTSVIKVDNIQNSTGTAAISIDGSGNVGIGTTSPSANLDVASSNATIHLTDTDDTTYAEIRNNGGTLSIGADVGQAAGGSSINFKVDNSEIMRIDSSGTTSFHGISGRVTGSTGHMSISEQSDNRSYIELGTTTTINRGLVAFFNPNGVVGAITLNGSSTTYNTSSDYRLKENVTADWDATTRLKQLNPVRFNFIADADTTVDGFLAHEVQSVVPEAITGTHDEVDDDGNPVYQGIDQSKLVPLLVKTIQELEARIAALETA